VVTTVRLVDELVVAGFVLCLVVVRKSVNVVASARSPSDDSASPTQLAVGVVFPASETRVGA
jgi:hypothetical protein